MEHLKQFIESAHDFPNEGKEYRDIQPLLENPQVFNEVIFRMTDMVDIDKVDYFVGIESRGFIFASTLAADNIKGFKMIRKAGKLPNTNHVLHSVEYDLEYGSASIEMKPGEGNVVIVDDVYATGGTMEAAERLCKLSGYNVIDKICLVDIGIKKQHDVKCLITY